MMKIFGIGTDIIEVERVKKAIERSENFKNRVFSTEEIIICNNKAKPYQSYAARFAAKEAIFKAMGTGWADGVAWTDISISQEKNGKPIANVYGKVKEFFDKEDIKNIHISMSHLKEYAIAYVILES